MRRGVLLLLLLIILGFVGYRFILKPTPKGARKTKVATTETGEKKKTRRGKRAGKLKAKTEDERKVERERKREERRRRRAELRAKKRQEREARRATKRKGKRSSRKKQYQAYVLQAVIWTEVESYAMIDGKRIEKGDIVVGRKVIDIKPNQITVEHHGTQSTIRIGQSLLPSSYFETERRRRR